MATRNPDLTRLVLVVIAVVSSGWALMVLTRPDQLGPWDRTASAELAPQTLASTIAFPIQFRPGVEGVALIDNENQTICIYQYDLNRPAHERLVLLAARSFRYDRRLTDYNTASPRPHEVRDLISLGSPAQPDQPTPDDKHD